MTVPEREPLRERCGTGAVRGGHSGMFLPRFLALLLAAVIGALPFAHAAEGSAGGCATPHALATGGGCCDQSAAAGPCDFACQAYCPVPVLGAANAAAPEVSTSAPAREAAALSTGVPRAPDTAPPKAAVLS